MNDFFDSLKEIKKEMAKEQISQPKKQFTKEDAISIKEKKLRNEFLSYIKNNNITKIN